MRFGWLTGFNNHQVLYKMNNSTNKIHYQDIATDYANFWFYENDTPYQKWQLEKVKEKLALQSADKLCDIGGGPGNFAARLSQLAQLSTKALVVEPNKTFVDQATFAGKVVALHQDAATFAAEQSSVLFDKILLKEVIHHLPTDDELIAIFRGLRKRLTPNGALLIMTRPQSAAHFPFFKGALQEWSKHQLPASFYMQKIQKAGFTKVIKTIEGFPIRMPRTTWHQLLRQRFWSNLTPFSDIKIEKGIQEIEERFPEGNHFIFEDQFVFILAS